jgi:enamine deaminase RidA (YjgF/YER057c/UK114 family)
LTDTTGESKLSESAKSSSNRPAPAGIRIPPGVEEYNKVFTSACNCAKDLPQSDFSFPSVLIAEREMNINSNARTAASDGSQLGSAEQRLKQLGINLPAPPPPFGTYVEAVQTGNLLFLTGMLPTDGHEAKFTGRVGAELDVEEGRKAAHLAALNVLAVAREHLGSLDKVTRIVRLGVSVATLGDVRDQPNVADAASELLQNVFGKDKNPCRLVYGVASLPLGAPVELEVIFEVG